MKTLLIHLISFYQVIAVNCVQPVNWKYCYRVDQWLIPDLIQGYKIWSEQEHPYQNEKDYLRNVNQIGDGTALEKR